MTVPDAGTKPQVTGTGVALPKPEIPITFEFFDDTDVLVTQRTISTGLEGPLTNGTHYTISGGNGTTGTVIVEYGDIDFTTDHTWTVTRNEPKTQTQNFENNTAFLAETTEATLDRLVQQTQELEERIDRCIQIPVSDDAGVTSEIPSSLTRALKYLSFDASGNATTTDGLTIDPSPTEGMKVYNIKDYETNVGTGNATTDTAAIVAALADVPASGGIVYFPPNAQTYSINGQITVNSKHRVTFLGSGFSTGATPTVKMAPGADLNMMFDIVASHGVTFLNMSLDGNGASQSSGVAIVRMFSSNNFKMERCTILDAYDIGIKSWTATVNNDITLRDCYLSGNPSRDIDLEDTGTGRIIDGCEFQSDSGAVAIRLASSNNVKITNCHIEGANRAITLNAADDVIINAISTADIQAEGIYITTSTTSDRIIISNSQIYDCANGGTTAAIWVGGGGTVSNVVIAGNVIYDGATDHEYGIEIASGTTVDTFESRGNLISGVGTAPYSVPSTGMTAVIIDDKAQYGIENVTAASAIHATEWASVISLTGGGATVQTITGGYEGRRIIVSAATASFILEHNAAGPNTIKLRAGGDYTFSVSAENVELIYSGNVWFQTE